MEKTKLIKILKNILNTDRSLDFLSQLNENELASLVAMIRDRVDNDNR